MAAQLFEHIIFDGENNALQVAFETGKDGTK